MAGPEGVEEKHEAWIVLNSSDKTPYLSMISAQKVPLESMDSASPGNQCCDCESHITLHM